MQFTYPELFWALFLLLIPILIHLFQLRRFIKTPFTNVKVLQKIQAESRRSKTLKKWLLLFTRLLLLAALIFAFAKPYIASKSALIPKETVIYLDDSYSMQTRTESASLFETAKQDLIKSVPKDEYFTLFTNEKVFKKGNIQEIQNELLALPFSSKQLKLNEISLKASTFFETDEGSEKNLIIISDFQQRVASTENDSVHTLSGYFVKLNPSETINISIDSAYIENEGFENTDLSILLSANSKVESTPVSLFNGEKLIAKASATFDGNQKAQVSFTIPSREQIMGKIEISDAGLGYDNELYFNIEEREKIRVMSIGSEDTSFLSRIFVDAEFELADFTLQNLNYGSINGQNLVILNELEAIPSSLTSALGSFIEKGGNLTIIPSDEIDFDSYVPLLSNLMRTRILQAINEEREITDISFDHPLFKNVFEKNVTNFQYPKVARSYRIQTNQPSILLYQDKSPFLVGSDGMYFFTASLNDDNCNFKNSPLIVPTFYKMGINSLKLPSLYHLIGDAVSVDVPIQLEKDHILKLAKADFELIPQQQAFSNKVALNFSQNGMENGIYQIMDNGKIVNNISFNYPKEESDLTYLDVSQGYSNRVNDSISNLFEDLQNDNSIKELWKWFVILALLFLIIEILIQKYL